MLPSRPTKPFRASFRLLVAALLAAVLPTCSCPPCAVAPVQPKQPSVQASGTESSDAFHDASLPIEERIDALIAALRKSDKIDMLSTNPSLPRLGVKGSDHLEGLHGLAMGGPGRWGGERPVFTTTFPQAIGLASTWDPEIVQQAAAVEGREARWIFHVMERGGIVIRAPNADLGRDPRWGRNEECYGEDPHLAGRMAVAFVRGLQGDHPKYLQTAALLKHFVANTNEDGRGHTSSDFDERQFHEYYAAAFRAAFIEADAQAFMAAYNAHNGVPCTTHPMLEEIVMKQWGQDGIICTDAGALKNLVTQHKQFSELPQAAAASVKAGISQFLDRYREPVSEALEQGALTEADIDEVIRKNFRVMIRLGLLDPPENVPYTEVDRDEKPWQSEEHQQLARRVAEKSIVLLKNEKNTLPLDAAKLKSLAVIGPHADSVHLDWYSGTPPYTVSALAGIRKRVGDAIKVESLDGSDLQAAAKLARSVDRAIVVVGNHPTGDAGWAKVARPEYGKEAVDRKSIELADEALVKKVFQANPRTIVVLLASFPYAINWTQKYVPAIVHSTHNGQELGNALAGVLFGDVNPAGRLVQTWPRSLEDLPPIMDYDLTKGRTYLYSKKPPLYPFGFGLSYSEFEYSGLAASAQRIAENGSVTISVDLKNVGSRAGEEVVQLYVKRSSSKIVRPQKELKAFARVSLKAGEKRTVKLELRAESLKHWDTAKKGFVLEPGPVELHVGRSSADLPLTTTLMAEGAG